MATKYATQYDNAFNNGVKVGKGDIDGQVRSMFAEYVMDGAVTAGDVIKLCKLPKGARVIEAQVITPAFGGAGELDLGWLANDDEVADPNGFIDGLVTAAVEKMSATFNIAGLFKQFTAETEIALTSTITTTAITGTFKVQIDYVLV